ncbi:MULTISPECIES: TRAP transporter substrate-binding protein [unclassified Sedimentibacter]|uniref:TRAP transporter substrate-binding protein n=1 Tax=unclassified Sedimentibacter TaxID=2649220 RepID=UPI0027DFBCB3|nr:TRAP transporter substrate-binding protein [Sedimentibacter sp. MB35-C1]WMJ78341.1 TRAP transporter substrate-binding protein [Sedimentibacter sp. MB35-C1]
MKKFLAITISVVLLLGLLNGCSESSNSAVSNDTSDGTYTITLAHSTTEVTSFQRFATSFKEYAETNSGGKITVNIYPNAQLGGDREIIEGTQTGSITLIGSSAAPQVNFVPSAVINDLPFVFTDKEQARKVLSDLEYAAAISAEYEKAGFKYLGSSDQGFRALTSNKEVHAPADVQGMTLRTMENKYHMEVWKQIGANPTPLPFNELYTALQQGTVDAQENPIELIYSQKFYEQQDYIITTNHIYQPVSWIMNKAFYDSLPDDLKAVVDEGANKAIIEANKYQDDNLEKFRKEMEDYGVTVVELTPEELSAFSEKAKSAQEMIQADCEPAVYDAFMKALNK